MREKINMLIYALKRDNFARKPKLKRRLRKKLRVGEFQELGFEVKTQLRPDLTEIEFDKFVDDFIENAVEKNGLLFGGGGSGESGWSGVLCSDKKRGSATKEQSEKVRDWLSQCQQVTEYEISELRDSWHGDFD